MKTKTCAMAEIYSIETKFEVLSGEREDNEFRLKVRNMLEEIIGILHLIFVNIESYEAIMSNNGESMRVYSPSFVSAFNYSSVSTNILLISNLFDSNKNVLSLYKLVNFIEANKCHIETKCLERRDGTNDSWSVVSDGILQNNICRWKKQIELMKGTIFTKINKLRDKFYAHKDINFHKLDKTDITFSTKEFNDLINAVFDFVNEIASSIFYCGYAFFEKGNPDINQTLHMISNYKKYKKDVLTLIRNGTIKKR